MNALEALIAAFPGNPPEPDVPDKYRGDWLMRAPADVRPLALFRPRSTAEVAKAVTICAQRSVPIVPQGGLTGLTGGVVPGEGALVLSLERMAAIEQIDPLSQLIVVQAGVPLQAIQEAADAAGLLFPLDIGSRGSCQIGGNLSTNAGGNRVLRYGMARALVLGLEVVLADGSVVSSMNRMLKNNAGFDLKQVFIGSEGTLGIITRAVLRLFPAPAATALSLASFADYPAVEAYLGLAREMLGEALSAFEVMWGEFYIRAVAGKARTPPLPAGAGAYALVELSTGDASADAQMAAFLEAALARGLVQEAVLAQSLEQARAIWGIRDFGGEIVMGMSPVGNFDLSFATSDIHAFVQDMRVRLAARWPGIATIVFGHVCDGNIHLVTGNYADADAHAVEVAVYEITRDHAGSISAEHGIGLHKRDFLHLCRSPAEIALMRRLKVALDPAGLMNPGKVLA